MTDILRQITASKRLEIAAAKSRLSATDLERRLSAAPPVRDFRAALDQPGTVQILAEVKRASPSKGILREDFDPVAIARTFEKHGAAAISVLTDEPFFQGKLSYLSAIRAAVTLPVLRKDFILEEYQILEARAAGADAILLIAECLNAEELPRLLRETHRLGMEALVELYEPENLSRVIGSGADLIGVNNRNLRGFETRLEHTLELASRIPANRCLVSESGIRTRTDIELLQGAGVRAVLIGETFMRAPDIGAKLDELRGVRRESEP
jgi:indole-3-glycerol phosphate synthase